MNILFLGHIPSWAGGQQETGLANVIYNLSLAVSNRPEVQEVILAATDVNDKTVQHGPLRITGWKKKDLLSFMILHPFVSMKYFLVLIKQRRLLPPKETLLGVFFKGLFLRKTINENNVDLLHLHEASSWFYVCLVPKRIKIVVTFHGPYGISNDIVYRKSYSVLEKCYLTSNRVSRVCFISHKLERDYKAYYNIITTPVSVVLNAFDDTIFHFIEHKPHVGLNICTIGTIQSRKGQMRVAEAIKETGTKCNFFTVGQGSPESIIELNEYCEGNGINHVYLGKKSPKEIRLFLSEMDYMVLPSSSEGFGLVFLESIACGVKVVLPKGLPIVEEGIIQPGINAYLLEDYKVKSISKFLIDILSAKDYDHEEVSKSISSLSWQNIAGQYVSIYKDILC